MLQALDDQHCPIQDRAILSSAETLYWKMSVFNKPDILTLEKSGHFYFGLTLNALAEIVKREIELQRLQKKQVAAEGCYGKYREQLKPVSGETKASLINLEERARVVLGIHDIYGFVYETLDFTNPFSRPKQRIKAAEILRDIVLARIANPLSKRASVKLLENNFGIHLNLDNVYQMMDRIDESFCARIQDCALGGALRLSRGKLQVLFYDATTLYFESFTEDELKKNGYSKDMKFNQPQVLLALFVTTKGLPVGYEVLPGNTFEGHTLIPALEKLKTRYNLKEIIFVADRGMLSKNNIAYLDGKGFSYIVGSRIRSLKKAEQEEILNWARAVKSSGPSGDKTYRIAISDTQNLVLSYKESRVKKDRMDREKAIQKLQARLGRSKNPKQLISRYGFQKFIKVEGDAELRIDETKLQAESSWDGIVGIVTNNNTLTNKKLFEQYKGLWQVEESFRISKHDLRIRPVYHWTPNRVRAHIAISFMAFTCVRYLEYRLNTHGCRLSPEQIRENLLNVQGSIVRDKKAKKEFLLPSAVSATSRKIYKTFGIKLPQGMMRLKSAQA